MMNPEAVTAYIEFRKRVADIERGDPVKREEAMKVAEREFALELWNIRDGKAT